MTHSASAISSSTCSSKWNWRRWHLFMIAAFLLLLVHGHEIQTCEAFQNHQLQASSQLFQAATASLSSVLSLGVVLRSSNRQRRTATAIFLSTNNSSSTTAAAEATTTRNTTFKAENSVSVSDSLERLMVDVSKVCNVLRPGNRDLTLPPPFHKRRVGYPSFTTTWSFDDWDRHLSRRRYGRWFFGFFKSRLLRRVLPMLTIYVLWSSFAVVLWQREATSNANGFLYRRILSQCAIPLTPLSLISSFLAFLLTLRSNHGLGRLMDGRKAIGEMVLYTREMASLIAFTIYPRNPQIGLKLIRHVALFGWLLKAFLRGPQVNGSDEDIIRTMLPHSPDADYVMRQRKPPVAVISQLRQAFYYLAKENEEKHHPHLSTAEEIALDHCTQSLNHCIMATEKILASPIPPLYTALTGRLLLFYLVMLPFALRAANVVGNGVGTVLICTVTAYAMMGLDEMSHLIEQPFRLMPLYQLSKQSMMDVADSVLQLPPSYETGHDVSAYCPMYWPRTTTNTNTTTD